MHNAGWGGLLRGRRSAWLRDTAVLPDEAMLRCYLENRFLDDAYSLYPWESFAALCRLRWRLPPLHQGNARYHRTILRKQDMEEAETTSCPVDMGSAV